jgi:hypothetical protein
MTGNTDWKGTTGFVYVATGAIYFHETAEAVRHLRAANPTARVCVVTDKVHGEKFWDEIVVVENPTRTFRDKLLMALCPYERFVYLDCDTYVAGDLSEMFDLLAHFEVIGHQLFEGHDYRIPGVPDAFPEFNGGVFGFRRGPGVERLFARWRELFEAYAARNTGGFYDYTNVGDQKGFRIALYESGLRHSVLGPEYDFIIQHVQFACAAVKIFHGRTCADLQRIEKIVNARLGQRAWVPILDVCVMQHESAGGWARLAGRASLQALRMAGLVILPAGLRRRLREMPWLRRRFLRNEDASVPTAEQKRKWGKEA